MMYKWVQKEIFFLATLAFVFVATASVSSFLKNHLQQETALASTARVFWPENQAAVYPKKPPESFFTAQAEAAQKDSTATESSVLPTLAHSKIQNVVSGTPHASRANTAKQTQRSASVYAYSHRKAVPQRQVYRKATATKKYRVSQTPPTTRANTRVVKRTGAASSAPQKTSAQKSDTLALRAYDVHMKWVKKTLADYREKER
jgi:hypothetical protein